jgi:hypothetical protein
MVAIDRDHPTPGGAIAELIDRSTRARSPEAGATVDGGGRRLSPARFSLPTQRISHRSGTTAPARKECHAPMKTARERAEEKRQEKLELVREQVENGALVIRQMTEEERLRYPPRPPRPKRSGKG